VVFVFVFGARQLLTAWPVEDCVCGGGHVLTFLFPCHLGN
jgi:hypothetical protein